MKKAILSLAVISMFVTGALAKTQALTRKDGRKHVGLITKDLARDGYTVKMRVGEVFVPADQVASIEDAGTAAEEFRDQLAKIKPADVKARYKLAKWAFSQGLLTEPQGVLKGILKIDPSHERAQLLLKQISAKVLRTEDPAKAKQNFRRRKAAIKSTDAKGFLELGKWAFERKLYRDAKGVLETSMRLDPDSVETAKLLIKVNTALKTSGATSVAARGANLLSTEDISRVRLEEFRLEGDIVRVKYRNRVLQRFVKAMSGRDQFEDDKDFGRTFLGYTSIKQLRYILDPDRNIEQADLDTVKKDIFIDSDPMFMKRFRTKIWPVVKMNCASATCHGAAKGVGGLKLFNTPGSDVRVAYTNFIILVGTVDKKDNHLVDRDINEDSLLLEYLLPRSLAKNPHPKTKRVIRNLFKNRKQPAYKILSKWIASLANPGYPNFKLDYKPPFGMKLKLSGGGGPLRPRVRRSGGTVREKL
jgi:hypothetical protein